MGAARWAQSVREFLREVGEVIGDIVRRPAPHPVRYQRCDRCGGVAPRDRVRHYGRLTSDPMIASVTPPEYPCPLCEEYSPRVVGDEVDPGDPAVPTMTLVCTVRFGLWQGWRQCRTTFTVPAVAALVHCPACGARYTQPT